MKRALGFFGRAREKGQSLTEVALFMPIFIILLAGVVEVSQLIIAQNRVSNAARTGARFMANGGEDEGMVMVSLNAITQTLSRDDADWDIWSIRGTVNADGNEFSVWEFEHVYGISNTARYPAVDQDEIRLEVLAELSSAGDADDIKNLGIVGAYMIHDVESILGLDAIPWLVGANSIRGLSVMRMVGFNLEATDGCDAFPIAVHEGIRSVTPPGEGAEPYPEVFHVDSPKPEYSDFTDHVPDKGLDEAEEGYVYKIYNGSGEGNFGWLVWNEGRTTAENVLEKSLTYPGDSKNYAHSSGGSGIEGLVCPGWAPQDCPYDDGRVRGYVEPGDPTDSALNIGDWVRASPGSMNSSSVRLQLIEHITKGRELRFVVWDSAVGTGSNALYHVDGFAVFKLHGYNLTGSGNWILAEFIRRDDSCGQPQ